MRAVVDVIAALEKTTVTKEMLEVKSNFSLMIKL